jgi:hypothetical protein
LQNSADFRRAPGCHISAIIAGIEDRVNDTPLLIPLLIPAADRELRA